MEIKVCTKCNEEKPLDHFSKAKTGKDDLRGDCKDCRNKKAKTHYKENKRKINIRNRKNYYKNRERDTKRHIENNKKRYKNDVEFRILTSFRTRLNRVLKGIHKTDYSLNLLGCTSKQLKEHLETQFKPGMSWDNYGVYGWHIDHIIPCSKFDMNKEDEQKQCFNYKNLQPLWAEDNWKKSDNIKEI